MQKKVEDSIVMHKKKALLVVSFGTSYEKTRKKTFDVIEAELKETFYEYEFRKAYTSPTILRILRERDGICIQNVSQSLEQLAQEGFEEILIQPTFILQGIEYEKMKAVIEKYRHCFCKIQCGNPLLSVATDYESVAVELKKELSHLITNDSGFIFMGHGTEHGADESYKKMQNALDEVGFKHAYLGTVEGQQTFDELLKIIKKTSIKKFVLIPFMIVAGDHACEDMAGEGNDSWKSQLEKQGYEVTCILKGMGEYRGIREMFIKHAMVEEKKKGTLYGIGVGPGDPELMTLKSVKKIKKCDVIVVPGEKYQESVAYKIALQSVPELQSKKCLGVVMPMTRDEGIRNEYHDKAAEVVASYLEEGKDVGFLNLGDVTIYATYLYVHRRVKAMGYDVELINGIPSFCASAAKLGIGIAENAEQIHILSQPEQIEEGLKLPGTKVIMKMGKNMAKTKARIKEASLDARMVENCGMETEKVYQHVDEISEDAGYFSLLIVKEQKNE